MSVHHRPAHAHLLLSDRSNISWLTSHDSPSSTNRSPTKYHTKLHQCSNSSAASTIMMRESLHGSQDSSVLVMHAQPSKIECAS
jgi:hypothetical protein